MSGEDGGRPITAARVEAALDKLALIMAYRKDGGIDLLPIYERLERELDTLRGQQSALARAHERARQVKVRGKSRL